MVSIQGEAAVCDGGAPTARHTVGRHRRSPLITELALRESEERFTNAFHHAAIGMAIVGLDGRWLQVNPALCVLTGYDESELLALTFQDITHPDDLDADLTQVQSLLDGATPSYRIEKRYVRRDGTLVWVLLSVSLVRDVESEPKYFIAQIQDISDRRVMERELTEQHALFRAVFETAPIGISLTNGDAQHLKNNARRRELLGYSEEELLRLTFEDFTHPEDLERELVLYQELVAGKRDGYALDKRYLHKDGSTIWVHLTTSAVRAEDGQLRFIVAMIEDITERKASEQALEHRAQHDPVTGLPNRCLFNDRIDQALSLAARRGEVVALLFLDLDGFKAVNDMHGHERGDMLLRAVGDVLFANARRSDTVARWAGDEFAVLLSDIGSARNAERTAQKFVAGIAEITAVEGRPVTMSASVGVSLYPFNGADASALLEAADAAMYLAKQGGRGRTALAMQGAGRTVLQVD